MQQDDWHEWRLKGLGASDAPVVMQVSPWKTRYQLYEEKAGLTTEDASNWATKRGNELEPKARAHYELLHGREMPVAFVQHKTLPFIRASLDGYNEAEHVVLEIKCPGKDDHALAVAGSVPEKYWPQIQHQLLASGANCVHYYSFDGEAGALVVVEPDYDYIAKLVQELTSFWDLVTTKTPPELSDRDFKQVKDATIKERIELWKAAKETATVAATLESNIREQILGALESHPRWRCDDVRISKVSRIGAVDYGKIPELAGVDLNQYRKKGSQYWTIK